MRSSNRNESRSSQCYCSESTRRQSTQLARLVMAEGTTMVVVTAVVVMAAATWERVGLVLVAQEAEVKAG